MERTVERVVTRVRVGVGGWLVCLTLGVKALVLIGGGLLYQLSTGRRIVSARGWLEIWNLWDAPHYLDLAQHGYARTGDLGLFIVFYPLFPWLTRLLGAPLDDYLVGAFLVSTIASVAAALLFYRLVALDDGPLVAQRAVWFLLIFPTAYVLHIGYTESLFLALVFGCLLAARTDRWALAGVLGAAAALTRVNGLLLMPVLGMEALYQLWQTRRWRWHWLWIGLVGLGFAVYLLLNWRVTGDPFTFSRILREHWYKSLAWPWVGLQQMVASFAWRRPDDIRFIFVPELVFISLSVVVVVLAAIKLRPAYATWAVGNVLLFLSTSFILSVPRYSLILFPLYILLARASARRGVLVVASVLSLAGLVGLMMIFVLGLGGY